MKRLLSALVAILTTVALAGQGPREEQVLVKTGMAPGKNPLVSVKTAIAGTVILLDANDRRVPCAVRTDASGGRFVAWRIANAKMLELMDYRLVASEGPQEDAADIPAVLPGMNLFANADFSRRDANGDIADWSPSPRGYGIKSPWDETARAEIRAKGGFLGLKGEAPCLVTYVCGLEAGHVYRLSYDGFCRKGFLAATMWYQGETEERKIPNAPLPNVGNYKLSTHVSVPAKWEHVEDASYCWYDRRAKRDNLQCRGLLPGTTGGYFYFYVKKGEGAVKNVRLEDVTSDTGVRAQIVE